MWFTSQSDHFWKIINAMNCSHFKIYSPNFNFIKFCDFVIKIHKWDTTEKIFPGIPMVPWLWKELEQESKSVEGQQPAFQLVQEGGVPVWWGTSEQVSTYPGGGRLGGLTKWFGVGQNTNKRGHKRKPQLLGNYSLQWSSQINCDIWPPCDIFYPMTALVFTAMITNTYRVF